jgi:cyanophycin synthetase
MSQRSRDDDAAIESLIDAERYSEAAAMARRRIAAHPDDATAHFLLASTFDAAGDEAAALALYERALSLGLPDGIDLQARIQYASTLRNRHRADDAVRVLRQVKADHASSRSGRMFLSLALLDADQPRAAVHELLDLILQDPGPPERYRRSLRAYADELLAQETEGG